MFFSNIWTGWTRQAVQWDTVAIDLSGERGDYFRSFKGLMDSLFPLLFNLVTDALSALLELEEVVR